VTDWAAAADAIAAEFSDRELLAYTSAEYGVFEIPAIRHEQDAPQFSDGKTLRRIAYEIQFSALRDRGVDAPTKRDTFTHRGRLWRVSNITTLDDVFAWDLDVTDGGQA
jgi:hypothetical protein